jgi:hypothetical protein
LAYEGETNRGLGETSGFSLIRCYLGGQIKEDGTIGACSTYEGEERIVMDFGGKSKEKRPHGRPRYRWKNK